MINKDVLVLLWTIVLLILVWIGWYLGEKKKKRKKKEMTDQFCPYCDLPLSKINDVYVCPKHGRVLLEVDKEENGDKSYIR